MKHEADGLVGVAGGAKALGVLLRRQGEPPKDHQRDGEQSQDRRHQAGGDGGHGLSCEWCCPRSGVRLTPSLYVAA